MVLNEIQKQYAARKSSFYRDHYHHFILALIVTIALAIVVMSISFYQVAHRPLPQFSAVQSDGKKMLLVPYQEPNLLPSTILRWASKAATVAYTFNFINYQQQVSAARPYFTTDGWQDYLNSVSGVISTILQNKIFINGVVSGTPVIANQGPLPGKGYVWRVQIPFKVRYQSLNGPATRDFIVVISILRVPTNINPQGIGIDQFVMR
jgi:intracellular multiplication protein IcmL